MTRPAEVVEHGDLGRAAAMFPAAVAIEGGYVVAYSTVPDGWPGGEVHIVRSLDGGQTWTPPVRSIAPEPGADAVLGALGLARLSDGRLLLPVNEVTWDDTGTTAGRQIRLRLFASADQGQTWTEGAGLDPDFAWPAVYGQILERPDGELLWPIWGRQRPEEAWRAALLGSGDGGHTWHLKSTIAHDPQASLRGSYVEQGHAGLDNGVAQMRDPLFRPHDPTDGFSETTVAELADGRLVAVLRQQGVDGDQELHLYQAWSSDGGATWTAAERLPIRGTSPALARLADGRTVLAIRRHLGVGDERAPAVELRVGDRGAHAWGEPIVLRHPDGIRLEGEYQCGYPALVPEGEGLRVFFYTSADGGRFLAWNTVRVPVSGENETRS